MLSRLFATVVGVVALVFAARADAQSLLAPPPASVCVSPNVPTQPGDVHMFPGRWWNPKRHGIGWDFFYGDGQQDMYLTWFTFDPDGRPVWLHGEIQPLSFNAVSGERTWQSRLYLARWDRGGVRDFDQVGQVSVTFPNQTTTRAAVRWRWDVSIGGTTGVPKVDDATHEECLLDTYRDSGVSFGEAVPVLNQAYSSNWFYYGATDHPLTGWGLDLLIDKRPSDGHYVETATAAIYDDADRSVWLQSVDDWGSYQPPGSTMTNPAFGQLRYIRHRKPGGTHPAITDCQSSGPDSDNCTYVAFSDTPGSTSNRFSREILTARTGNMLIKANVPASATTGAATAGAAVIWPPVRNQATAFPNPVPVFHVDSNHIIVDKTICRVPTRTSQCSFTLAWVTEDTGAIVRRINLNRNGELTYLQTGLSNTRTETLNVGDRFQYSLSYMPPGSGQIVTLRTPEIRVLLDGEIADENLEPVDCESGPGCDLGVHKANVGAIDGEASAEGGTAGYSIPIKVPPGRNGVQPVLALRYNSRDGNQIAGMGWGVTGLSVIHRCPRTIAQDGVDGAAPITFTESDALCLDGQRLVTTSKAQEYGSVGAIYRTEIDSFVRVEQFGDGLGGKSPSCFSVKQKSGAVTYYGGVPDGDGTCVDTHGPSRVVPVGASVPLSWKLSRVQDPVGNSMAYYYAAHGSGELLIDRIQYTGDAAAEGSRRVKFLYEPRIGNDRSASYFAGVLVEQTQRLTAIQSSVGGVWPTSYRLSYEEPLTHAAVGLYSGRSLLQSVTQCAWTDLPTRTGDPPAVEQCLDPTIVSWNDAPVDFVARKLDIAGVPEPQPSPNSDVTDDREVTSVGDFDGDGVRELLVSQLEGDLENHRYLVRQSAERGTRGALDIGSIPWSFATKGLYADFDGDGRTDIIAPHSYSAEGTLALYRWKHDRTDPFGGPNNEPGVLGSFDKSSINIPSGGQLVSTEDVDHDGLADLVMRRRVGYCNSASIPGSSDTTPVPPYKFAMCFYRNTTVRTAGTARPNVTFDPGVQLFTWQHPTTGGGIFGEADLNGDGVTDPVIIRLTYVDNSYEVETVLHVLWSTQPSRHRTDCADTPSPYFQLCDPAAVGFPAPGQGYASRGSQTYWMDVNGDQLTDVLYALPPSCTGPTCTARGTWHLHLSDGRQMRPSVAVQGGDEALLQRPRPVYPSLRYGKLLPKLDVDGDGRMNLLYPVDVVARHCNAEPAHWNSMDGTCNYPPGPPPSGSGKPPEELLCSARVWMCANDVAYDLGLKSTSYTLPSLGSFPAIVNEPNFGAAVGVDLSYSPAAPGISNYATDRSLYAMAALRFVPAADGSWHAEKMSLNSPGAGGTPHRFVAALRGSGDFIESYEMYGDGLIDMRTSIGCNKAPSIAQLCRYVGDGTTGPSVYHVSPGVGQPLAARNVSELNLPVERGILNENVGVAEVPGSSPVLPELVRQIENGLGDTASWLHVPLSASAGRAAGDLPLYEIVPGQASYADARHFYFQSTMPVVASFSQSNGTGGTSGHRSFRFGYREAIYNNAGRGFLGFRTIVKEQLVAEVDADRRQRSATTFHQKFPLSGRVEKVETGIPAGELVGGLRHDLVALSREVYEWGCNVQQRTANCDTANGTTPASFPYLRRSVATRYDLGEAEAGRETALADVVVRNYDEAQSQAGWDAYGNLRFTETDVRDKPTADALPTLERFVTLKRTRSSSDYDETAVGQWWINKLARATVTTFPVQYGASHPLPADAAVLPSQLPSRSIVTTYDWNPDRTLHQTVLQPGGAANQKLTTIYEYPVTSYGQPSAVRRSGQITESQTDGERLTRTTYDGEGYFPVVTREAVEAVPNQPGNFYLLTTTLTYRAQDGLVTDATLPSGISTRTRYDAFGRSVQTERFDANGRRDSQPTRSAWVRCRNAACSGALVGEGGYDGESTGRGAGALQLDAAYRVTTTQNGSPTSITWFDLLGRKVKTAVRGFDGTFVVSGTAYDALGQVMRETAPFLLTKENNSAPAVTRYSYDRLGRVTSKQVKPANGVATLDPAGGNLIADYSYSGSRTRVQMRGSNVAACTAQAWSTAADNRCMSSDSYHGVLGLMRTVDTQLGVTRYWHDAVGHLVAMADANANALASGGTVETRRALTASYDELGRRVAGFDPNQGAWQTTFNSFDEPMRQTDARGAVSVVAARDMLGRALAQTRYLPIQSDGSTAPGFARNAMREEWRFNHSTGQLSEVAHCETSVSSTPPANCPLNLSRWGESYAYDSSARREYVTTVQEVWGTARSSFITRLRYDTTFGRENAIEYPSGLRVQRRYQKFGALRDVLDADTGARYWGVGDQDAWGNVTREEFGNGMVGEYAYSPVSGQSLSRRWRSAASPESPVVDSIEYAYDSLGNLTRQTRRVPGATNPDVSERYAYDTLQRLVQAIPDTLNVPTVNYAYDAVGNLTKKSDFSLDQVGAYVYPATLPAASGCGPNVATQVSLPGSGAPKLSYTCDKSGNLIEAVHTTSGGAGTRTLRYDPANRIAEVRRPGATGSVTTRFRYTTDGRKTFEDLEEQYPGPDMMAYRHQLVVHGRRGFSMEIPYDTAGGGVWNNSQWGNALLRHELGGAVVTYKYQDSTNAKVVNVAYRASDRLGSPLGLMDGQGLFQQRLENGTNAYTRRSFDAFGQARESDFRRRPADTQTPYPGQLKLTPATRDGFTGHEHLDGVGLIHMNGRVYDYQLGRFVSVDPVVQFPANSQGLNPYSYILNNPLSGTDPSGFRIIGMDSAGDGEGGGLGWGSFNVWVTNWNGIQVQSAVPTATITQFGPYRASLGDDRRTTQMEPITVRATVLSRETLDLAEQFRSRSDSERALGMALADRQIRHDNQRLLGTLGSTYKIAGCLISAGACALADADDTIEAAASGDIAGAVSNVVKSKNPVKRVMDDAVGEIEGAVQLPTITVEEGLDIVAKIRAAGHVGGDRNIAFAVYNINGRYGYSVGSSGTHTFPNMVPMPENRQFEVIRLPGEKNPRDRDAEVKLLEEISAGLPLGSTGTMFLFSELPVCRSCGGVIKQFESKYPGIIVDVLPGPRRGNP